MVNLFLDKPCIITTLIFPSSRYIVHNVDET